MSTARARIVWTGSCKQAPRRGSAQDGCDRRQESLRAASECASGLTERALSDGAERSVERKSRRLGRHCTAATGGRSDAADALQSRRGADRVGHRELRRWRGEGGRGAAGWAATGVARIECAVKRCFECVSAGRSGESFGCSCECDGCASDGVTRESEVAVGSGGQRAKCLRGQSSASHTGPIECTHLLHLLAPLPASHPSSPPCRCVGVIPPATCCCCVVAVVGRRGSPQPADPQRIVVQTSQVKTATHCSPTTVPRTQQRSGKAKSSSRRDSCGRRDNSDRKNMASNVIVAVRSEDT